MTELCEKNVISEDNTSNKHKILLGYYNYTVVLTYIGMFVGFAGLLFSMEKKIPQALICLMVSGFCDMFDGAIASTMKRTKQEKRFGIQIDSLSDLICFGVLPAIIVASFVDNPFKMWICGLHVLCALVRLAYFNVDEEERQDKGEGKRVYYSGLPVTSVSILLPLLSIVSQEGYFYLILLLATSVAFLLPVRIKKPNWAGKTAMMCLGLFAFINVLLKVL